MAARTPRRTFFVKDRGGVAPAVNAMMFNFTKIMGGIKSEARAVAKEAGREVIIQTTPLTPMDTGALRASAKVTVDEKGNDIRATVSYGGETPIIDVNSPDGFVRYAVEVHEDMERDYFVGGPKFLAIGAQIAMPRVQEIITERLKKSLE